MGCLTQTQSVGPSRGLLGVVRTPVVVVVAVVAAAAAEGTTVVVVVVVVAGVAIPLVVPVNPDYLTSWPVVESIEPAWPLAGPVVAKG